VCLWKTWLTLVCFDFSCKETARQIFLVLKIDNSKRFSKVVHLIEACSKNGNLIFHKCVSTDAYVDVLLASLKRVRGKHKVIKKLETKAVSLRWENSESQLLGLI